MHMISKELRDYVGQQRRQGVSEDDIKRSLAANQWQSSDIEEALRVQGSMHKNILTLVASVVVSVAWLFIAPLVSLASLLPLCSWDPTRLSCFPLSLAFAFPYLFGIPMSVVTIPLVFGILGAVFSGEERLKQAAYSFGISLLVAGAIILPGFFKAQSQAREEFRIECERQRQADIESWRIRQETDPGSIKNVYVPPPCE